MKLSTIRNSLLSKNLFRHGLLLGLLFWLGAQIPFTLVVSQYFFHQEIAADLSQQASLQKLLTELYEQGARFGDIVNARGAVLKFGAPFGLKDLGVCRNGREILPRPLESRCKSEPRQWVPVQTSAGRIDLEFQWTPPSISDHSIPLRAIGGSAMLSLFLVLGVVILLSRKLSTLVSKLAGQIASSRSLDTLTQLSSELEELTPISSALHIAKTQLNESLNENLKLKTEVAVGNLATQVSHDIPIPPCCIDLRRPQQPWSPGGFTRAAQRGRESDTRYC
ncbi:hypothetical protein WDW86_16820, partial [Bdellovibrionota bacterium FG-2]